jgi:alpha-tubulin suppressor-like RCC1 family protein
MTPVCKNIYAGRNFCLALSQDNKLLGWGSNQNGQLMQGNRTVSLVKGSTDLGF